MLTPAQATQQLQKWIDSSRKPFSPRSHLKTLKIRRLISWGADINIRTTDYGSSVLMIATISDNPKIMSLLLEAGAHIDASNTNGGVTPLGYAVIAIKPDLVELLLEEGANPFIEDRRGWTPLRLANTIHCSQTIKDLVNAYAIMNRLS